jgi:hypothetical protein
MYEGATIEGPDGETSEQSSVTVSGGEKAKLLERLELDPIELNIEEEDDQEPHLLSTTAKNLKALAKTVKEMKDVLSFPVREGEFVSSLKERLDRVAGLSGTLIAREEAREAITRKAQGASGPSGSRVPVSDIQYAGKRGYYQDFSTGRIYYHPDTGAHWVYGAILVKYLEKRGPRGFLGYPTTDERDAHGYAGGRYNDFQGGSIYWKAGTGAHTIFGSARAKWRLTEAISGHLGFPTYDQVKDFVRFENGVINRLNGDMPVADSRTIITGRIHTNDGDPVKGSAELILSSDGTYSFSGNIHNSGFVSYDVAMVLVFDLRPQGGPVLTFSENGDVEGTSTIGGSRDHDWNHGWRHDPLIKEHWAKLMSAVPHAKIAVDFSFGDLMGVVLSVLIGPIVWFGQGVAELVEFIKGLPIEGKVCCPYYIPRYQEPFDQWSVEEGCVRVANDEDCPPGMV